MMDREEMLALYDRQMRIELEIPGEKKEAFPNLVRFVRAAPGMNYVLYSKLEATEVDQVIKEQIDFFSQLDQPFNWKIFEHDEAASLVKQLQAHGYERVDDEYDVIMVLDLEAIPERLLAPVAKDVRRLRQADQLKDVVAVLNNAYGGDFGWLHQRMGPVMEIPGYVDLYAGYENGEPVACGWAFAYPNIEFTAFFGGTTIEAHRHKGWFASILAARVQHARSLGRRYATVGAEPEIQSMLEKFGFERISSAYYLYWQGDQGSSS
ncbi:MAG: hypothetical protein KDE34_25490 [Anaerolineales bacterium]|nr:hypothetical protein [Anaerolineales bacterium]